jgi:hypothetical protein
VAGAASDGKQGVNSSCECTMNSVVSDFMRRLIMEAFSGSIIELFDYKRKILIR